MFDYVFHLIVQAIQFILSYRTIIQAKNNFLK